MNDWIESMGLRMEGFSDAQIAQINSALPDVLALSAALKSQMPLIMKIAPDVQALLSAVVSELPRINKVLPIVQMILSVVEQKQKEYKS